MEGHFYKPRHIPHFDQREGLQFITYCSLNKEICLNQSSVAEIICNSWNHYDGKKYDLISWVIMLDHVHVLVKIKEEQALARIVQSRKSFSAHSINQTLNRSGSFWQKDYWDTVIRDDAHLLGVVQYMRNNPVVGGLVTEGEDYPWYGLNEPKLKELLGSG